MPREGNKSTRERKEKLAIKTDDEIVTKKMSRKSFGKELRGHQVEPCRLQEWFEREGLRMIFVFERRDGARLQALLAIAN